MSRPLQTTERVTEKKVVFVVAKFFPGLGVLLSQPADRGLLSSTASMETHTGQRELCACVRVCLCAVVCMCLRVGVCVCV